MGFFMFIIAAIIFFLDAAKISHIDPLWGFFFLAMGHIVGYVPWPADWRVGRRP